MDDATKGFGSGSHSPFFTEEHEMLRDQVRRFVEEEIKPFGDAWEKQGFVPRDVLRRMGALGFFGIRYPEAYGGSAMDTLGSVVLAEELGRSDVFRRRDHRAGAYRHGLRARLQCRQRGAEDRAGCARSSPAKRSARWP